MHLIDLMGDRGSVVKPSLPGCFSPRGTIPARQNGIHTVVAYTPSGRLSSGGRPLLAGQFVLALDGAGRALTLRTAHEGSLPLDAHKLPGTAGVIPRAF
jgi:hypothetical protein